MQIHFVTGCLAEHALRSVVTELSPQVGFGYTIQVLPITVAALMTPEWIARRIVVPQGTDQVLIPGYCQGDLQPLLSLCQVPVVRGPRDLQRLPQHFGQKPRDDFGVYNIQIVAEINSAPRYTLDQIVHQARALATDGADVIDLGCDPGVPWPDVAVAVQALRDEGLRVSIDSLDAVNIAPAVRAGAELVLSVNRTNRAQAADWGCEVVVIPDTPDDLDSLRETVEYLAGRGVRMRLDPILEPIGFGFAASLQRYATVRKMYPDSELFMGIGNLTELTDADSAAINVLLLAYCQELGIRSVLTTQVINWARTSVRECDLARRLVYYAVEHKTLPKHLEPRLIPLRGEAPRTLGNATLDQLAVDIKDHNYRIFAENGEIHLIWAGQHLRARDPFALFAQLQATQPKNLDSGHAFYLGFEFCKALTALTLHKQYEQDTALDWGYLTREEQHHRLRREKVGTHRLLHSASELTENEQGQSPNELKDTRTSLPKNSALTDAANLPPAEDV